MRYNFRNVLREFIIETLQLRESATVGTSSTVASSPTSSGTKVPKGLEVEETDDDKDKKQKGSFLGQTLEKAKTLAQKPPIGQEVKKIVRGPGQPKEKVASAGKMLGSLIAQQLPNIEKINPNQISQEFRKKGKELADDITAIQQLNKQQAEEESQKKPNPLISKK